HAILAAKLDMRDKAYEMYLRTARLDLDDYNNDTEDGCHITSMAGTWMAVVKGFGGMRVFDERLHFAPYIPEGWSSYSFKVRFRGHFLQISVRQSGIAIRNRSPESLSVLVYGQECLLPADQTVELNLKTA
ncbi:MAG: glycoside hydrolase family 65 protein, partial [Saprospiraceae bacterium]|nr:glycoside hydrolase family 65 protein [Saprospiraceae bacterium]